MVGATQSELNHFKLCADYFRINCSITSHKDKAKVREMEEAENEFRKALYSKKLPSISSEQKAKHWQM